MLLTLRRAPSFRIPLCRHVGVWIFFSFGLGDACPLVAYAGCVVCFALFKRFRTPFCGRGFRFYFRVCLFLVHLCREFCPTVRSQNRSCALRVMLVDVALFDAKIVIRLFVWCIEILTWFQPLISLFLTFLYIVLPVCFPSCAAGFSLGFMS